MYLSNRFARSRRGRKVKSSGVVSINVVLACPVRKVSFLMTFSMNGMFVCTPRIRNSFSARSMRSSAIGKLMPLAVILTSNES